MESSFKIGGGSATQKQNSNVSAGSSLSQTQGSKNSSLFSMDTLTDQASAFRIRNVGSNQQQPRVPTVYGMPKLKTKTLPKMKPIQGPIKPIKLKKKDSNNINSFQKDQQQPVSKLNFNEFDAQSIINTQNLSKLPSQLKPGSRKQSKQLDQNSKSDEYQQSDNKIESSSQKISPQELKEETKEQSIDIQALQNKSRISTAKSTMSNVTDKSLANVSSVSSLNIDPNMIFDENSVLAQLVKTNIQLLQKCLVSQNKAIFIAAIESLKNASNNFGPALNKHLPLVLQLVKKKQDLAAVERIHELKEILIQNGGEEAELVVNKMGLK
eukprot:403375543